MAELTASIAGEVVQVARAGADEAEQALSRALDAPIELSVGDPATLDLAALPADLDGPGLVIVLIVGGAAALALVPQASGVLPTWYEKPDATGESKLTTLAQELGMLLLPEAFMPTDFRAGRVTDLRAALARGGVTGGAGWLPISMSSGQQRGTMHLVWPAGNPGDVLRTEATTEDPAADDGTAKAAEATSGESGVDSGAATYDGVPFEQGLEYLPPYTRSLLCIRVPVRVTLAEKKQAIENILALGPGSIIQFDKSCDEMLELEVGNQRIAKGEAVKVGEKFGLRITSIILPGERLVPMRPVR